MLSVMSRPVWGAWIEIGGLIGVLHLGLSRPVWGAWIEMIPAPASIFKEVSRAPYGARGLKLLIGGAIGIFGRLVAPRMGRVD